MHSVTTHVDETTNRRVGMIGNRRRRKRALARAAKVVDVLRTDLPAFDAGDTEFLLDLIARQLISPSATFELIVDSPVTANWRLKPALVGAGVRLSDYAMEPSPARRALTDHINASLAMV